MVLAAVVTTAALAAAVNFTVFGGALNAAVVEEVWKDKAFSEAVKAAVLAGEVNTAVLEGA